MSKVMVISKGRISRLVNLSDEQMTAIEWLNANFNCGFSFVEMEGAIADLTKSRLESVATTDDSNDKKETVKPANRISVVGKDSGATRGAKPVKGYEIPDSYDTGLIVKALEDYRLENNLTKIQLGEQLGICDETYRRWMNKPSRIRDIRTIYKICDLINMPVNDFIKPAISEEAATDKDEFAKWAVEKGFADETTAKRIFNWAKHSSPNHESVVPVLSTIGRMTRGEMSTYLRQRDYYIMAEYRSTSDMERPMHKIGEYLAGVEKKIVKNLKTV